MNVYVNRGLVASALILAVFSVTAQTPEKAVPDGSVGTVSSNNSAADRRTKTPDPGSDIGEPVYELGGSVRPPVAIYMPDPKFSKQARKAKFSGNVIVVLVVDSHGNPRNVHVVRGVGMGLDESALHTVKKYRFMPALMNGKAVAVRLNIMVKFVIRDGR